MEKRIKDLEKDQGMGMPSSGLDDEHDVRRHDVEREKAPSKGSRNLEGDISRGRIEGDRESSRPGSSQNT